MGPIASILLRRQLTHEQLTEMDHLLKSISIDFREDGFYKRAFWVENTAPIGGDFPGTRCTIDVHLHDAELEVDPKEFTTIQTCFGFLPQQRLQFDAGCNSEPDHKLLGLLILYFAEKFDGIIDLGGALSHARCLIPSGSTVPGVKSSLPLVNGLKTCLVRSPTSNMTQSAEDLGFFTLPMWISFGRG
jgi:hypothetical protein